MSTKSKSTPKKPTSATPKSSKITSKPSVVQSPKLSTPTDKPTQKLKPSESQSELNVAREDLKKAKEKLTLVEREKVQALEEVKKAQKLTKEANEKLREALVAQKQAEEKSEIEKSRADEIEQVGIKVAQKEEEEWKEEVEAWRNQHDLDAAALLSATEELRRVKQELAINCNSKNQGLSHADDATIIASLKEKVGQLEMSMARQKGDLEELEHRAKEEASEMAKKVESLISEFETLKEEKNQAIENKKLAEDTVQTEKSKLTNDLTSALQEVFSVKERLLASQAENKHSETQIEDLKLALQETNEKYENMLDEAKEKIDVLTKSFEQFKDEHHQILKAEWERKELHLMSFVNESEERNSTMEKEINRLVNLLKQAEKEAHLNGGLRIREASSLKEVEELSKLLEEALAEKEAEENGGLSDCEKDYDMLPKVVEFSEENGGVGVEKPIVELLPHLSDQPVEGTPTVNIISHDEAVHTSTEEEKANGKLNENENKEKEDDASAKGEFKMWESCTIGHEDASPEGEAEQEGESESKIAVEENNDRINKLSSVENLESGNISPTKKQSEKKKKPLFHKFGSLLKRRSSSSQN